MSKRELEQARVLSWEGKLLTECTRQELLECIKFMANRTEALRKERRAISLAGIVAGA